ncbi:MAG TPA: hypothetical protein VFA40_03795 [Terriglobales bacterium]|nr:hypothetical protein [Terriglobales bacterium]
MAAGSAFFSSQVNLGLRDGQRRSKALNDGGHPRIFTAAKVGTTLMVGEGDPWYRHEMRGRFCDNGVYGQVAVGCRAVGRDAVIDSVALLSTLSGYRAHFPRRCTRASQLPLPA